MNTRQTDNSNETLKLEVRAWLLEQIQPAQVLDLFCGQAGRMWSGVWRSADSYFGVDKHSPHCLAQTVRMSAERAVKSLDLNRYNLFDIDTYSSPWLIARRICRRRGPGTFGLALTSGEFRGLENGHSNEIIRVSIGARGLSDYRLLGRYHDLVLRLMIRSLGEIPGTHLLRCVVTKTARNIAYLALTIDK